MYSLWSWEVSVHDCRISPRYRILLVAKSREYPLSHEENSGFLGHVPCERLDGSKDESEVEE